MRILICLIMLTSLSSGCWRHRAHRLRSYNSCVGCDDFEAPVMKGPNRKEVRELRKWYRQLNREETLSRLQEQRLSRQPRGRNAAGVCPCCHSQHGTASFSDMGMCGSACETGTGWETGVSDYAYGGEITGPDMLGYDAGYEGDWEYADDSYDQGWTPSGQTVYDDGMYHEGDSGGTYCPHCQQQQQLQNYGTQLPPIESEVPMGEYISPTQPQTRTVPPVSPEPMSPSPMSQDPAPTPMPMTTPPMGETPMSPALPTDDFVPNNETSYVPADFYSPPPLPLPAPAILPAPILSGSDPVQQTRWTPTR